jgi:hypothetical protein
MRAWPLFPKGGRKAWPSFSRGGRRGGGPGLHFQEGGGGPGLHSQEGGGGQEGLAFMLKSAMPFKTTGLHSEEGREEVGMKPMAESRERQFKNNRRAQISQPQRAKIHRRVASTKRAGILPATGQESSTELPVPRAGIQYRAASTKGRNTEPSCQHQGQEYST